MEKFLNEIEAERQDALKRREQQRIIIEQTAREREALKRMQLEEKTNQEKAIRVNFVGMPPWGFYSLLFY